MTEIAQTLCMNGHRVERPDLLPNLLTHTYDPARGAFRNLCSLLDDQAEAVLADIRRSGRRNLKPNYLRRRRETEGWLAAEAKRRLDRAVLDRPIYFFLGDYADGLDASRPASIQVPLDMFPNDMITFTYADSMTGWAVRNASPPEREGVDHLGIVFTRPELESVVAQFGLPARDPDFPARGFRSGFIEAQVWNAAPLAALLGRAVPAP